MYDVGGADEIVGRIDDAAKLGIFTDGFGVEDVFVATYEGSGKAEGDDFETIWVYDGGRNISDGSGRLDA